MYWTPIKNPLFWMKKCSITEKIRTSRRKRQPRKVHSPLSGDDVLRKCGGRPGCLSTLRSARSPIQFLSLGRKLRYEHKLADRMFSARRGAVWSGVGRCRATWGGVGRCGAAWGGVGRRGERGDEMALARLPRGAAWGTGRGSPTLPEI